MTKIMYLAFKWKNRDKINNTIFSIHPYVSSWDLFRNSFGVNIGPLAAHNPKWPPFEAYFSAITHFHMLCNENAVHSVIFIFGGILHTIYAQ